MALHAGLIVLKYAAKPAFEVALEYYGSKLIKYEKGYLKNQIDALCDYGTVPDDSYAARVKGYYSIEEAVKKIAEGKSELAKQIHEFTVNIHEDDGFIVIEKSDSETD
jgi:hypothetical protein